MTKEEVEVAFKEKLLVRTNAQPYLGPAALKIGAETTIRELCPYGQAYDVFLEAGPRSHWYRPNELILVDIPSVDWSDTLELQ